jgi:16S rRNA (guanine966-N2)-methyltransferase
VRIVAGRFKGRRLKGPAGPGLRPTSDRLRETLFNVLRGRVEDARVLDAFAGTGAVGLEALSRGASHVTFVERDRQALQVLLANIAACRVEELSSVKRGDFTRVIEAGAVFDLVFLDPPYEDPAVEEALELGSRVTAPAGLLILEHSRRRVVPTRAGNLSRSRLLEAGDSSLSFYTSIPPV